MKKQIELEMMIIIAERGEAEKIIEGLDAFAHFPSIIRGKGTAPNDMLSALGIGEPEKDMLFLFCEHKNVEFIYKMLDDNFGFKSNHRGIAMTIPVSAVGGNVSLQILLGKTRNLL